MSMQRKSNRPARRRLASSILAAGALLATTAPWVHQVSAVATTTAANSWHPMRGLTITTIHMDNGPEEIRVIKVNPSRGPMVDIATAAPAWGSAKRTSDIALHGGGVAGVNGDFASSDEVAAHPTMIDGEIWTTGASGGVGLGISANGTRAFGGRPRIFTRLRPIASLGLAGPLAIATWNEPATTDGAIGAFTARGGDVVVPPGIPDATKQDPRWCAARLVPLRASELSWVDTAQTAIMRRYRVTRQPSPCQRTPMPVGTEEGAIVIAALSGTDGATNISSLAVGDIVRVAWGAQEWPGVTDIIGGVPVLVDNRTNVAPPYHSGDPYILDRNPRTSVGFNMGCADDLLTTACRFILMVVDGRRTGWSVGMQMPPLADVLLARGAVYAINLDGGGSSTMWMQQTSPDYCQAAALVGGCIVNKPATGDTYGERKVSESLTVLPGADPGTPPTLLG